MEIDDAVLNDLIAERDRLMEFVKDALPQLKIAGQYLITAGSPYTGSGLLDLAARAEAILEDK